MRAWDTALFHGRCSYNGEAIEKGDRVFIIQGTPTLGINQKPTGRWRFTYCAICAVAKQNAPPDTGEVLGTADAPGFPEPLKDALAAAIEAKLGDNIGDERGDDSFEVGMFDAKAAAAGPDPD